MAKLESVTRGGLPTRPFAWVLLCAALAGSPWARAAEERKPSVPGVRIIRDVPYGPHGARNLLDIYLPEGGPAPRPLVICIHGGGWAGGDKRGYAALGELLARRGFAAVSLTYRFAPAWRAPTQMDDVQRAVRWLRKNAEEYGLDPKRFGAIGGSAGGHLASYLGLTETRDNSDAELAKYSSRVQCVVDCYGPVDLVAMMSSASAPIVQGFIGKPLAGNEEDYRRASPVTYVAKDAPPFLILHGTRDVGTSRGQVPMEQSVEFHEKLRKAGAEATLIKVEGAGHGFSFGSPDPEIQKALAATLDFFTKHLMKKD
ncbi:MAG TPA: alpha/beta hydrolase [Planctomycetota bacterium]|nr:alpha/beta hydrolase [Planctomycetota bacterium]HRR80525.1 alpha/beta hydrolase [Planctomycetota bacterium]HRT96492.1 alpha/beta hydrolase [Planctomycetota bacterium]